MTSLNKGLDQFDYVTSTQSDDLINTNELETAFLTAFDALGLVGEIGLNSLEQEYDEYDEYDRLDYDDGER